MYAYGIPAVIAQELCLKTLLACCNYNRIQFIGTYGNPIILSYIAYLCIKWGKLMHPFATTGKGLKFENISIYG